MVEQWVHFDHQPYEMKMTGEVIWIHPDLRFYRVRFTTANGASFTESYRFWGKQSGTAYTPNEKHSRQGPQPPIVEGRMLTS